MNRPSRWKRALAGLCTGLFLSAAVLPGTGWIIHTQIARLTGPFPWMGVLARNWGREGTEDFEGDRLAFIRSQQAAASRHPEDLGEQIAAAGYEEGGAPALRELIPRFPRAPSLYAAILCSAWASEIPNFAEDRIQPNGQILPGCDVPRTVLGRPPSPRLISAYLEEAAAGESVDPDNAFFPVMRAAGLFDTDQSAAALAELHRAAQMPRWQDYRFVDEQGRWRLYLESGGDPSAFSRLMIEGSVYTRSGPAARNVGELAVTRAMDLERAGRLDEGMTIRRDLMAIGRLIRNQSPTMLTALAGVGITRLAILWPGGLDDSHLTSAPLPPGPIGRGADYADRQLRLFSLWARVHGYGAASVEAQREMAAGAAVKTLVPQEPGNPMGQMLLPLLRWWMIGLLLLSNIAWLLALSAVLSAYARWRSRAGDRTLSRAQCRAAGVGVLLGAAAALPFLWSLVSPAFPDIPTALSLGCILSVPALLGILLAGAWSCARRRARRWPLLNGMARVLSAMTLAALATIGTLLLVWLVGSGGESLTAWGREIMGPITMCMGPPVPHRDELAILHLNWLPLSVSLPLALTAGWALLRLLQRRRSGTANLTRLRQGALNLALVLIILYVGVVEITSTVEHEMAAHAAAYAENDTQYLASRAGIAWPPRAASPTRLPRTGCY